MEGTRRTAAWAIAEALSELGVDHVFGLLGSGNYEVTNALVACGARFVSTRHEAGAVLMADVYARLRGGVGVCSVHQGPGVTNTATGLGEAAKSRTPLLVLAADTPAAAPCWPGPASRSRRWPSGPARCWRPPPPRPACSHRARGRSASRAASRRRWPSG